MVIAKGEKIHVMTRRRFEEDIRRHFVGEVVEQDGALVRLVGYVFIYQQGANEYIRMPEKRTRILSLSDSIYIINVIPADLNISSLEYKPGAGGCLVFTDGQSFSMQINEFGTKA